MYGEAAAENVAQILLLSQRATETGLYFESYAKRHLWLPDPQKRWFDLRLNGYDAYKEILLPKAAERVCWKATSRMKSLSSSFVSSAPSWTACPTERWPETRSRRFGTKSAFTE